MVVQMVVPFPVPITIPFLRLTPRRGGWRKCAGAGRQTGRLMVVRLLLLAVQLVVPMLHVHHRIGHQAALAKRSQCGGCSWLLLVNQSGVFSPLSLVLVLVLHPGTSSVLFFNAHAHTLTLAQPLLRAHTHTRLS